MCEGLTWYLPTSNPPVQKDEPQTLEKPKALEPCVHCGNMIAGGGNTKCPKCGGYQYHEGIEMLTWMAWAIGGGMLIIMILVCCGNVVSSVLD